MSKNIVLGVTGGIAAYKTPELVRRLTERGATVQVVLTEGAKHFVTPTTLQAVSGRPVRDNLWDEDAEAAMGHIELARWADDVIVAPATAEFMSRLAAGAAPDLADHALPRHPSSSDDRARDESRDVGERGGATEPRRDRRSGHSIFWVPPKAIRRAARLAPDAWSSPPISSVTSWMRARRLRPER